MLMQSLTRREVKGPGGVIVPPGKPFVCDDLGLALELADAGLAEPMAPQILRRVETNEEPLEGGPTWPDIFVLGITADGRGGGERSLKRLVERLGEQGYWAMLGNMDVLHPPGKSLGLPYPKCIILQCSAGHLSARCRQYFPQSLLIQYVQNVSAIHKRFRNYHHVLCNSEFSAERCREMGAENVSIQMPPLDAGWARADETKPEYVLAVYMTKHKGGEITEALAAAMPDTKFVGIDNCQKPIAGHDNISILSWQMDMRPVYAGAKVFLAPSRCDEAFGRTVAEAMGNGIPCVVGDRGNHPWFAEQRADLVEVVSGDRVEDWRAAVERALKKGRGKPWAEAWEIDAAGTIEVLEANDIRPGESRPRVAILQKAGIGDALMTLPYIAAKSRTHDVYMANGLPGPVQAIFEMCPFFMPGKPTPDIPQRHLPPFSTGEPISVTENERRQESIARRGGARLSRYQPLLSFDNETIRYVRQKLPDAHGRRLIGVSLAGHNRNRNIMPERAVKPIIKALAKTYEIVLIHDAAGHWDFEHVHDLGGQFTVRELVHVMPLLDGVVAIDAGAAHVAGATLTPLVVILGMVGEGHHIRYKDAYGGRIVELCKNLDCQPCWARQQERDCVHECLLWEPEPILDALKEVLL